MGWNGSTQSGASASLPEKKTSGRPSSVLHGLIAGGLVVAIGVIVLCFVIDDGGSQAEEVREDDAEISELRPVAVPVATNAEVQTRAKPADPNARPTKVGEYLNGYVLLPSGRLHRRVGVITNAAAGRPKGKYAIFDRSCNNEIACMLTLTPGDSLVGTKRYNGSFKRDFMASLKEPIIVSASDSPEDAKLKRDVIAARLQLKDAMDRGEDIEKIMAETRQELQDLMVIKSQYRKLFYESKNKCETEQDVADLLDACNKLLEEKGVAPLKYGPITRRNLLRQNENEGLK